VKLMPDWMARGEAAPADDRAAPPEATVPPTPDEVAAYLDELVEAAWAARGQPRTDEGPLICIACIPLFQGREADEEALRRRKETGRGHCD
jgi:hypothetical protein